MAYFDYLICLDFEATCWPNNANKDNAEIIEFAAVLLNVRTRDIEDNFHYFIRPRINPTLSPYCRNLTGITQALVDEQDTFPIVYQKWVNWLTKLKAEKNLRYTDSRMRQSVSDGANTTFCSWSDFDMGFFFRIECERNGIDCPPQFKAWVDASIIFEQIFGWKDDGSYSWSFSQALQKTGISRVGNAHSGISDAINLAQLMMDLIRRRATCNQITGKY